MTTHDLIVIGGGAGGLGAAREAARRGAAVVIVERDRIGGDCTFRGCVPSKTLLAGARAGLGWNDVRDRIDATVEAIAVTEGPDQLAVEGVEVRIGEARLAGGGRVDVDGTYLSAPNIVVATGASPAIPPIEGLVDVDPLTSDSIFSLAARPKSLAIIGGGAIGCELGQAFAEMGTAVTLIEADRQILPFAESDAAAVIRGALNKRGVVVEESARVDKAERVDGGVRLAGDRLDVVADRVLVATGRRPHTDGVGLAEIGVELDDSGAVVVDATGATSVEGVWAAGDVDGRRQLTHAAYEMGRVAAGNALGRRRTKIDTSVIPSVMFTDPEVAVVGISEAEAARHGGRVARIELDEVDRARTDLALDDPARSGYVKLIAGPRPILRRLGGGRLVGATIVAPRAGELIGEVALAMRTQMFVGRLAQTTHPYPTYGMALQRAAARFFGADGPIGDRPARPNAR